MFGRKKRKAGAGLKKQAGVSVSAKTVVASGAGKPASAKPAVAKQTAAAKKKPVAAAGKTAAAKKNPSSVKKKTAVKKPAAAKKTSAKKKPAAKKTSAARKPAAAKKTTAAKKTSAKNRLAVSKSGKPKAKTAVKPKPKTKSGTKPKLKRKPKRKPERKPESAVSSKKKTAPRKSAPGKSPTGKKPAVSRKTVPKAAAKKVSKKPRSKPSAPKKRKRETAARPPFEAYRGIRSYMFTSYAHKDMTEVFGVLKKLNQKRYRIWYDEGIEPGNEWPEVVGNAVLNCTQFIVFMSPAAAVSRNVRNEINLAFSENKDILVVFLKKTNLSSGMKLQIGTVQFINKFDMTEREFAEKLVKVINSSIRN